MSAQPRNPAAARAEASRVFLPLAVSCLVWTAYLGLAPFGPGDIAWPGSWRDLLAGAAAARDAPSGAAVLGNLLVAGTIAFFLQGAMWRGDREPRQRLAGTALLYAMLALLTAGLAYGQALLPARVALPFSWAAQQVGIAAGILAWWAVGPARGARLAAAISALEDPPRAARRALAAIVLCLLLLPLAPGGRIGEPASAWAWNGAGGYFPLLLQSVYYWYKGILLWIPLGMLFVLAERQRALRQWILAALGGFALVALPWLPDLYLRDLLGVIFAPLGLWAGVWIGERLGRPAPPAGAALSGIPQGGAAAPMPARRALALLVVMIAAGAALAFPRVGPWLGVGLAVYLVVLWRYPAAWLLAVPAALPLLGLAPWTGRFFFDEFDLVMTVSAAAALWHGVHRGAGALLPRTIAIALALFTACYAISAAIGLLPLEDLDANAFSSYWSAFNSLRVAKGLFWALVMLALLRWCAPRGESAAERLFVTGTLIGLGAVILSGLRERWLYAGLFDLAEEYRITATFASMHTGDGHIEAYLVSAVPLLWLWIMRRGQPLAVVSGGLVLFAAVYLTTLTISRAGMAGLAAAAAILVVGFLRAGHSEGAFRPRRIALFGVLLAGAGATVVLGVSGGYFQQRLSEVERDWQIRLTHWRGAAAMMDEDWGTRLFGMGLGSFPRSYLLHGPAGQLPATYAYAEQGGNRYLSLGSGRSLYMAQRVPAAAHQAYRLSLDLRSADPGARLNAPFCEKHLLYSFRCRWLDIRFPAGDDQWHRREITFDSGAIGAGTWPARRSVELALYNPIPQTIVEVDNVRLLDEQGRDLIRNGTFSAGGDYWFFKTHDHLPWHIKNLGMQILFEQGWLGLSAFGLLVALLLARLWAAMWRGDLFASGLLAAAAGFLAVGIFGSLFDAPRLATWFFLICFLGAVTGKTREATQ